MAKQRKKKTPAPDLKRIGVQLYENLKEWEGFARKTTQKIENEKSMIRELYLITGDVQLRQILADSSDDEFTDDYLRGFRMAMVISLEMLGEFEKPYDKVAHLFKRAQNIGLVPPRDYEGEKAFQKALGIDLKVSTT